MSENAIVVENLSKRYLIGHRVSPRGVYNYTALRDVIGREIRNFARKATDVIRGRQVVQGDEIEEFWALTDVSFQVKQGEVLGIIGRNGAGKSTLLKILSRITEPTKGRVVLRGRVASLLEVGTGFHPELTGRENIFLNGAILGMTQREIRRKFDEIVAFAEVEKFLDTPVKHYSSGMYVRLAFAVAAHLESDIIFVDEVLAVGDAEFQKKCIGKLDDVSREGRTVLYVTHNLLSMQRLCTRGILLEKGTVIQFGKVHDVISNYLSSRVSAVYDANRKSGSKPRINFAKLLTQTPSTDEPLKVLIEWEIPERIEGIAIGIGFNADDGTRVFGSAPEDCGIDTPKGPGRYRAIFVVPENTFLAKAYTIALCLWSSNREVFDYPDPALRFSVQPGASGIYRTSNDRDGTISIPCKWSLERVEANAFNKL